MQAARLVNAGFGLAWILALVAIVGGGVLQQDFLLLLVAPAGMILSALGLLTTANPAGIRDALSAYYRGRWQFRVTGRQRFTLFDALLITAIGLLWFSLGLGPVMNRLD